MAWNRENFLVNKAVKRMNNLKSYVALPLLVLVLLGDDDGVTGRNAADPGVDWEDSKEDEWVLILTWERDINSNKS